MTFSVRNLKGSVRKYTLNLQCRARVQLSVECLPKRFEPQDLTLVPPKINKSVIKEIKLKET